MVLDNFKYSQSFLFLFSPFIFAGILTFYRQQNKQKADLSSEWEKHGTKKQGNSWIIFSIHLHQCKKSGKTVASVK